MKPGADYVTQDGVGIIRFNRPEHSNPIDSKTAYLVADMAAEAEADRSIGAIIITGTGDKVFCSGMDLKEAARKGAASIGMGHVVIPGTGFAGLTERHFTKPLIAAVNGAAVGGGCEIALTCDIIIAQETAIFSLPEVKRGLFAFSGGTQRVAKLLPRSEGMMMVLSGEPITAKRLYKLGVVSQLVPTGQTLDAALAFAKLMLNNSWSALQRAKKLFDLSTTLSLDDALAVGNEIGFACFREADAHEGISAFAEKREPKF